MEGLIEFLPFWLGYLAFAAVGYWCWQGLFFWLSKDSDIRRFLHMLGAVLLFTPAPIAAGSSYFAPAAIVMPFVALGSGVSEAMYSVTWMLGGLCVGVVVLGIHQLLQWLKSRQ